VLLVHALGFPSNILFIDIYKTILNSVLLDGDVVLGFDKKREHGSLRSVERIKKGTVENA